MKFVNTQRLAAQTVFAVLDHLNKWLRKKYSLLMADARKSDDPTEIVSKDREYTNIKTFVSKIPHIDLCRAAWACDAPARDE